MREKKERKRSDRTEKFLKAAIDFSRHSGRTTQKAKKRSSNCLLTSMIPIRCRSWMRKSPIKIKYPDKVITLRRTIDQSRTLPHHLPRI